MVLVGQASCLSHRSFPKSVTEFRNQSAWYTMAQMRYRIQCNSRAPQGLTNGSHGRKPVESSPHNHLKNRPWRGRPRMCFGLQDWATPSGPDHFMRAFLPWVPSPSRGTTPGPRRTGLRRLLAIRDRIQESEGRWHQNPALADYCCPH